ncbi:MAG: serine--tRNA ligase [Candidatus Nanoarchaeia archaeon]
MLDIRFIRDNRKLVEENIKKKFQNDRIPLVHKLITNYERSLKIKTELDELRHKRNVISEEINRLQKEKKDFSHKVKEAKEIPDRIKALEKEFQDISDINKQLLVKIPNIMHKSVPIGKDASENKVIKKWGKIPKFSFSVKNHVQLAEGLGIVDFDSSAITSGNGFYYLKNELGLLNQALIRFTIDHLLKKKYTYIEPPLMIRRKVAEAAEDFEAFQSKIYKIEEEDLYLIPTSEHAILGMLAGKTIPEEELPLKFFAYSMCFRKEVGSHGINEKGLWRTHQFNKVEQFIFCKPEDSWKYYDELQKNSEELYQKLKIPYRIFECCSGDLGDWKAKSSDLEAYRPTTGKYEEVGSLSNCTDYQARDLNIKCVNSKGEKRVLHTLNNTAMATSRAMVVLLENYQQKDGSIKIPTLLQKYMGGMKKIGPVE